MSAYLVPLTGDLDFKSGATGIDGVGKAVVMYAADHAEAYDLADDHYPLVLAGIPRGSIDVKELSEGRLYEVTVDYSSEVRDLAENLNGTEPGSDPGPQEGVSREVAGGKDPSMPLGRKYSVSTKGGTIHIKTSREIMFATGRVGELPPQNPGRLIGYSQSGDGGNAVGVDIIAPQPVFSINITLPELTLGYFKNVIDMTATCNSEAWGGLEEFCVLFEGADFSNRDGQNGGWDAGYHFRYNPPEEDIEIADGMNEVPFKAGWDYLDVWFETFTDTDVLKLGSRPFAAFVHRCYRGSSFDVLNILD
jgi:hypothetical protein